MEENVLGEYGFTNFYEINMDTPSKLGGQTTIHEAFHMLFTVQSIMVRLSRPLSQGNA